jgi:hypothetical protein
MPFSSLHDYSQFTSYPDEFVFKTTSVDTKGVTHDRYLIRRPREAMTGSKKEFVYADSAAGRELTRMYPQLYGALGRPDARPSRTRVSARKTPTLGGQRIEITNPNKPERSRFGTSVVENKIAFGGSTFVRELPAIIGQAGTNTGGGKAMVDRVAAQVAATRLPGADLLARQFTHDYDTHRFGSYVTNPITSRPLKVGSATYYLILIGGKQYDPRVTDATIASIASAPVFAYGQGPKAGAAKPTQIYKDLGSKFRVNINGHAYQVGGPGYNYFKREWGAQSPQWMAVEAQARQIGAPEELVQNYSRPVGPRRSVDAAGNPRPRSSRTSYGPLGTNY